MKEKFNLDKKDRKILIELYKNARAKVSEISKSTKIQRDSIKYRLQRMKKNKVYHRISPRLRFSGMGYPLLYRVDINIIGSNLTEEDKFLGYLKATPFVVNIEKITGRWDVSLIIVSKTNHHFEEIFKDIRLKYGDIIKDYDISTVNRVVKWWDYTALLELIK